MFLPVTRKYFLQIVCDGKNFFIRQEIQKYLEVKLATKQRELQQKFRVSLKISWEPGSLVPLEYPTLGWGFHSLALMYLTYKILASYRA